MGDIIEDANLGSGNCDQSAQLKQAVDYYLQVKAQNPNATITLTGHSLGGGLAALVGVFFGVRAVTFDQAPFAMSAQSTSTEEDDLLHYLQNKVYADADMEAERVKAVATLENYLQLRATNGGIPNADLVSTIAVQGEFLSSTVPFNFLNIIGQAPELLTHSGGNISMLDYTSAMELHSQAFLTTLLFGDQVADGKTLRAVSYKLPDLVKMIFDGDLFAHPTDEDKVNFLEHLVQHQVGTGNVTGDQMIERFTGDLWKIAQEGGLTMADSNLTRALTAFAMQAYYDNRLGIDQKLFRNEGVSGGIRFDRSDIADSLDAVKGYQNTQGGTKYFQEFLATLPVAERAIISLELPYLLDWFIQAGNQAMNATAGDQRALMLGGTGGDILTGGSQEDVLVGGKGQDTLNGGFGNDILIGGEGIDTYLWSPGGGNDMIVEERGDDGKIHDIIRINVPQGQEYIAAGGFIREGTSNIWTMTAADGSTLTLTHNSPWKLILADGSTLELGDFQDGDFGMRLYENSEPERTLTGTDADDQTAFYYNNSNWYYDFSGEISGTGIITGAINGVLDGWERFILSPTVSPSLHIEGGGGDDHLGGLAGEDEINGGSGNDVIAGDARIIGTYPNLPAWNGAGSRDILRGEAGRDVLLGWKGDDLLLGGDDGDFLSGDQDDDVLDGGSGNDLLAGGSDSDQLLGGSGDDVLLGDWHVSCDNIYINYVDAGSWGLDIGYDQQGRISSFATVGFGLSLSDMPGNDLLAGGAGKDYLGGGSGNDTLFGDDGHDRLYGGAGNDSLDGGAGNDLLFAEAGNDALSGGKGDDGLQGGVGEDVLYGGEGNDILFGEAGNDILSGDSGNDYLDGGDGDDVYIFGQGFGHDTVFDTGSAAADKVRFVNGVSPEDVALQRFQDHLILSLNEGNDTLILANWFASGTARVGRVEFANGTVWDESTIIQLMQAGGGPGGSSPNPYIEVNGDGIVTITDGNYVHKYTLPEEFKFPEGLGTPGGDWSTGGVASSASSGLVGLLVFWQYWRGQQAEVDTIPSIPSLTLHGTSYGDSLYGGAGDDKIYGEGGDDYLSGGDGNDSLYGGTGQDRLFGGNGDDALNGGEGDDFLDGGAGDDWLWDRAGNNVMDGGAGRDYFEGGAGDDTMYGGDGDDYFEDKYGGNNAMYGGAGNDDLRGGFGADFLDGGEGNDYIQGWDGNDTLKGGAGDDYLVGGAGDDVYLFGRGDGQDKIDARYLYSGIWDPAGQVNADTLRLAEGITPDDITLSSDYYYVSDGMPGKRNFRDLVLTIRDSGDSVTVKEWFTSEEIRKIRVEFSNGTIMDQSVLEEAPLVGTDGDDRKTYISDGQVSWWDDRSLQGGILNEVLDGRVGNDELYGGLGDDIYLFGRGAGQDAIYETGDGIDTVRFKTGIAAGDVTVWRDPGNLYLEVNGTEDRIVAVGNKIERVEFSDGTVWDESVLCAIPIQFQGTEEADELEGTQGDDILYGNGGEDSLYGDTGDDILDGGAGNDILEDDSGNNIYMFGRGYGQDMVWNWNDGGFSNVVRLLSGILPSEVIVEQVAGSNNLVLSIDGTDDSLILGDFFDPDYGQNCRINAVEFADGTVWDVDTLVAKISNGEDDAIIGTAGDDVLTGTASNDIMQGGTGNDLLTGGAGNDTYVFNLGDGVDTIEDLSSATEENIITFGAGIAASDLTFERNDSDLVIRVGTQGDAVRLKDFDRFGNNGSLVVGRLQFADGSQESLFRLTNTAAVAGVTPSNQTVQEDTAYSYTIPADTFTDADDGDSLVWSAALGNGNALPEWLSFDAATRTFSGTPAEGDFGLLEVAVKAIDTAGASVVTGFSLNVVKTNNAPTVAIGIPTLSATEDAEFSYTIPSGAFTDSDEGDTLTYVADLADSSALPSWLHFNAAARTFSGMPTSVSAGLWNVRVTATDQAGAGASDEFIVDVAKHLTGTAGDNNLVGTVLRDVIEGIEGNDVLNGYAGNDELYGGAGNDTLYGGDGNDLLIGGPGNDTLSGSAGDDIFVFNFGDGQDIINLDDMNGTDTLAFGEGIQLADLQLQKVGAYDLAIKVGDAGDQVKLANWFHPSYAGYRLDSFAFADGTVLTLTELLAAKPVYGFGTAANDSLQGHEGVDIISGDAGNDVLNGYAGNDELYGGAGSDTLYGGDGNDVLLGGPGNDTLSGGARDDIFVFNRGDGQDIINLDDMNGTDTLAFGEGIQLVDLQLQKVGAYDLAIKVGDAGDQVKLANWFHPSYSGYRLDRFAFADGTVLTLTELLAAKPVYGFGTAANDSLQGHEGVDIISGDAGNDVLNGYVGNDELCGGPGTDTLNGGDGNDVLIGGPGNDTLSGGAGDDIFVFNFGDGQDIINLDDMNGTDTLAFGEGIQLVDLQLQKVGAYDLAIKAGDGGDQMKLANWFHPSYAGYRLDRFTFADGTALTLAEMQAAKPIYGIGTAANDSIQGHEGVDIISGGAGDDSLYGYAGNDVLKGGEGNDTLTGGSGNDIFVFDSFLNQATNKDTITDFVSGQDKIELDRSIFASLPAEGTLASYFLANTTGTAADDNDYLLYNTTAGTLLYDADGNGQGVAIEFAALTNKPTIKAEDFIVAS